VAHAHVGEQRGVAPPLEAAAPTTILATSPETVTRLQMTSPDRLC
jgi:hypothetical protein